MSDAFITRRGGVGGEPIPAPTITFVSKTFTSITFTVTNNSVNPQDISYGLTTPPTTVIVTLSNQGVSDNITISGLQDNTSHTVYAQTGDSPIFELTVFLEPGPTFVSASIVEGSTALHSDQLWKAGYFSSANEAWVNSSSEKSSRSVIQGLTGTISIPGIAGGNGTAIFSSEDLTQNEIIYSVGWSGGVNITTTTAQIPEWAYFLVLAVYTARNITNIIPLHNAGVDTLTYQENGVTYQSHTFKTSATLTIDSVSNQGGAYNQLDYLIIAGGGAAINYGGAGAGGYLTTLGTSGRNTSALSKVNLSVGSYGIVVGAGGLRTQGITGFPNPAIATSGSNSVAFEKTAIGGGRGHGDFSGVGGSGAGGDSWNSTSGYSGTAGQGFDGARGFNFHPSYTGGGGGGAGQNGLTGTTTKGGKGGDGLSNTIRNGQSETRAGGGGGIVYRESSPITMFASDGGAGGGGKGTITGAVNIGGTSGTINTGGGGGAGSPLIAPYASRRGHQGGSGVVIVRYPIGGTL